MSFIDDAALDGLRAIAGELGPGDVVDDRFELREPLGVGGMGRVFSAWDRRAEREVAIKVVRQKRDEARFLREAEALAQLDHPGVVRYVAHGHHGDGAYVAMERVDGDSLATILRRGPLSTDACVRLGGALADALAMVHDAGIVHRDLKPANIIVDRAEPEGARLIDFGLARRSDSDATLTATGALVGTPGYMAPEQVRGDRDLDGAADVFALGAVLYECLAGSPAFVADTEEDLFAKIMLEAPPAWRAAPEELGSLVASMLDKAPRRRPSAVEVAERLAAIDVTHTSSTASQLEPVEGEVVADKYVVGKLLGRGGMGVVVAAKHRELGTQVALKILRESDASDEGARFLREARAAARLESEHAVRVTDVGRIAGGPPFIVMERLRGRDVAALLREEGTLSPSRAVSIVLQACEAIAEAHALGIIHRDLKPSNLFVTERRDGTPLVKVLDFGISKLTRPLDGESLAAMSITSPSAVMGSAAYMSPEQLRASRSVDARTDIWSLGVVLYELVTGSPPFVSSSPAAIGALIATEPPPPIDEEVPPDLAQVISRCLEKKPKERFADVGELADALAPHAPVEDQARASRIHRVLSRDLEDDDTTVGGDAQQATTRAWDASERAERPSRPWLRWAVGGALIIAGIAAGLQGGEERGRHQATQRSPARAPIVRAKAEHTPSASPSATASASSAAAPPPPPPPPMRPPAPKPAPPPSGEVDLLDPALRQR